MRPVLVLWTVCALGGCPPARAADGAPPALARAKAAEQAAFAAVEAEAWCVAVGHFLRAHREAPSPDLMWNAAQAADLAHDWRQALKLYVELVGAFPDSDRAQHVQGRIQALTAAIAREGAGSPCPVPPAPAAPESPERPTAGATTAPAAPAAPPATRAPPTAPSAPRPVEVLPGAPVAQGAAWAGWVLGIGGAAAAVGASVAGIGVVPYAAFLSAREGILAAERAGGDAAALQRDQQAARQDWQGWGVGAVAVGSTLLAAGLGAVIVGVVGARLPAATEEAP